MAYVSRSSRLAFKFGRFFLSHQIYAFELLRHQARIYETVSFPVACHARLARQIANILISTGALAVGIVNMVDFCTP
jgi:uncharacterized membrane protein YhhN